MIINNHQLRKAFSSFINSFYNHLEYNKLKQLAIEHYAITVN